MTQTPEALVRRLIEEGFNEGKVEVADELIADELIEHQWYGPNHAPGPEGVKAVIQSLRRAFSDFRLEIEDVTVADDIVWLRMTAPGRTTARTWATSRPAVRCGHRCSTLSG